MLKYASILALSLCACASTTPPAAPPRTVAVPVTEVQPVSVLDLEAPVTVELARGREAQVLRCSDELDCFQKLTGVCANGYNGGQTLHAGNDKVVGVIFKCITDAEKAEAARQEAAEKAQEAVWRAAAAARAAADAPLQTKPATKTHATKK